MDEKPLLCELNSIESNLESSFSRESNIERPGSRESNSESDSFPISNRKRGMQDMLIAHEEVDPLTEERSIRRKTEKAVNECDLYGQLLAQKLKPLDVDDRLVLMNEIDNLVFNYIMNVRKRSSSSRSVSDLPGPSTMFLQPAVANKKKR